MSSSEADGITITTDGFPNTSTPDIVDSNDSMTSVTPRGTVSGEQMNDGSRSLTTDVIDEQSIFNEFKFYVAVGVICGLIVVISGLCLLFVCWCTASRLKRKRTDTLPNMLELHSKFVYHIIVWVCICVTN